eukprot:5097845-Pleurochrysis_carterae.AAC.1
MGPLQVPLRSTSPSPYAGQPPTAVPCHHGPGTAASNRTRKPSANVGVPTPAPFIPELYEALR